MARERQGFAVTRTKQPRTPKRSLAEVLKSLKQYLGIQEDLGDALTRYMIDITLIPVSLVCRDRLYPLLNNCLGGPARREERPFGLSIELSFH